MRGTLIRNVALFVGVIAALTLLAVVFGGGHDMGPLPPEHGNPIEQTGS